MQTPNGFRDLHMVMFTVPPGPRLEPASHESRAARGVVGAGPGNRALGALSPERRPVRRACGVGSFVARAGAEGRERLVAAPQSMD